jgi:hemerythrin-like metal-binding protein
MTFKVAEEFLVHIKVLDDQHAQLFDLIDRLNTATVSGKGPKTGEKALAELCDYAHVHFEEEEGLMKKAGYAALSAHRVAHREFIEKIKGWMHDAALGHTKTLAVCRHSSRQGHQVVTKKFLTTADFALFW